MPPNGMGARPSFCRWRSGWDGLPLLGSRARTIMSERRTELRLDTALPAKIISSELDIEIPCKVLDLSLTGARLDCTADFDPPNRFYLLMQSDSVKHPCRLVWNKGTEIGVRFERLVVGSRPNAI
jgi:hypothetical protein